MIARSSLATLLLASALLVPAAPAGATSAGSAPAERAADCRHVLIVGAAGSGEQGGNGDGKATFGPTVDALRKKIVANLGAADVASAYVTYDPDPATEKYLLGAFAHGENSTFIKGFRRGVTRMKNLLTERVRTCPDEILVPIGYSQGAMVVVETLVELVQARRTDIIDRVAAVGLVANPFAHPQDSSIVLGGAPADHRGIFGVIGRPARLGAPWIGWVYEACYDYDVVCDTEYDPVKFARQAAGAGKDKHGAYRKDGTLLGRLATMLTNRVGWLPASSSQTIRTIAGQPWSGFLSEAGGQKNQVTWAVDPRHPLPRWATISGRRLTMTPPDAGTYRLSFTVRHHRVAPGAIRPLTVTVNAAANPEIQSERLTSGNAASSAPSISSDGRYVAFESIADNLTPGDTAGSSDVFVRDRTTGATSRLTAGSTRSWNTGARISGNGRYVVYASAPADPIMQIPNAPYQLHLVDRATGTRRQLTSGNGSSYAPSISDDGATITFSSTASDLVAGDTNAQTDIFVVRTGTGAITRVTHGNDESFGSDISGDGAHVYFSARASNLTDADPNPARDIYRWTRNSGALIRITSSGDNTSPRTTTSGRHVVFTRSAAISETVTWDAATSQARVVAREAGGADISGDGRYVAFGTADASLTRFQIKVWDRTTGVALARGNVPSVAPALADNGRTMAYTSGRDVYWLRW